jgi:hypothetical protein
MMKNKVMTPIIRASSKIKSSGLLLRPYNVHGTGDTLLAATTRCQLAARKNHVVFSHPSNTSPPMIISLNVGGTDVIHPSITRRSLSSVVKTSDVTPEPGKRGRRVWKAEQENMGAGEGRESNDAIGAMGESRVKNDFWGVSVDDSQDCRESLSRICAQVCDL